MHLKRFQEWKFQKFSGFFFSRTPPRFHSAKSAPPQKKTFCPATVLYKLLEGHNDVTTHSKSRFPKTALKVNKIKRNKPCPYSTVLFHHCWSEPNVLQTQQTFEVSPGLWSSVVVVSCCQLWGGKRCFRGCRMLSCRDCKLLLFNVRLWSLNLLRGSNRLILVVIRGFGEDI